MHELREVEGERRGLHSQPLGDGAGGQPFRPASHQLAEQGKPGFLSQRTQRRYRALLIHADHTIIQRSSKYTAYPVRQEAFVQPMA